MELDLFDPLEMVLIGSGPGVLSCCVGGSRDFPPGRSYLRLGSGTLGKVTLGAGNSTSPR